MPPSGRACDVRRNTYRDSRSPFLDCGAGTAALWFENGLPLTPDSLAKVSPAVVRPRLHIAVSRCRGELCVLGTGGLDACA